MNDKLDGLFGLCFILTLALLLIAFAYVAIFGAEGLPSRPPEYQLIGVVQGNCAVGEVALLKWGIGQDVRWAEWFWRQRVIAVVQFEPGAAGGLIGAFILLPSGSVRQFSNRDALKEAGVATPCGLVRLWEESN